MFGLAQYVADVTCRTGLPLSSSLYNSGLDHMIDSAIDVSLQEFSWPGQKFAGQREERFIQTGMKMKLMITKS